MIVICLCLTLHGMILYCEPFTTVAQRENWAIRKKVNGVINKAGHHKYGRIVNHVRVSFLLDWIWSTLL